MKTVWQHVRAHLDIECGQYADDSHSSRYDKISYLLMVITTDRLPTLFLTERKEQKIRLQNHINHTFYLQKKIRRKKNNFQITRIFLFSFLIRKFLRWEIFLWLMKISKQFRYFKLTVNNIIFDCKPNTIWSRLIWN